MKTLRNTLIIVLAVTSLGLVNLFAEKKAEKAKLSSEMAFKDPKTEKIRIESDQALREVLVSLLGNLNVDQTGRVNIIFKVSGNKHVEVLNVIGNNPKLVSIVKQTITKTAILVPEALEGKYLISVVF